MSIWSSYPITYRSSEVQALLGAALRGECAAVLGLSGAGKSNLLGFLAQQATTPLTRVLVDCNRLPEPSANGFWQLLHHSLGTEPRAQSVDGIAGLGSSVARRLESSGKLCLVMDRFDALPPPAQAVIYGGLRSLRDDHKYALTYIIAARQAVDPRSELAELFYAHTIWLGPLSPEDARWSANSYANRAGLGWDETILRGLIELSGGYPALLRAACEAVADGCRLERDALLAHPTVCRRLEEFWAANPSAEELRLSRLTGIPLLIQTEPCPEPAPESGLDTSVLTSKELRLWEYLQAHPGEVCEKDALIQAVWPEDRIFLNGIRDDSLAQLIRRLRQKVDEPHFIQTVPGRGYKYVKGKK
jgi:hypothetical protein